MDTVNAILLSPYTSLAICLLLGAVAMSGKFSQWAAHLCLLGVVLVGIAGIARSSIGQPRLLVGGALMLIGFCFLISHWIKPPKPALSTSSRIPASNNSAENTGLATPNVPSASEIADEIAKKLPVPPKPQQVVSPSFGNIKERAIALSQEIMGDLYRHGWPRHGGEQIPFEPVIQQMPMKEPEMGMWTQERSEYFHMRFFDRVLDIRNEFIQLHIRDRDLDDFFKFEGMAEDANKQIAATQPGRKQILTSPMQIENVAERLRFLADQLK